MMNGLGVVRWFTIAQEEKAACCGASLGALSGRLQRDQSTGLELPGHRRRVVHRNAAEETGRKFWNHKLSNARKLSVSGIYLLDT